MSDEGRRGEFEMAVGNKEACGEGASLSGGGDSLSII
jgi:hypothetical protein